MPLLLPQDDPSRNAASCPLSQATLPAEAPAPHGAQPKRPEGFSPLTSLPTARSPTAKGTSLHLGSETPTPTLRPTWSLCFQLVKTLATTGESAGCGLAPTSLTLSMLSPLKSASIKTASTLER